MADVTYTYRAPSHGTLLHVQAGKGGLPVVSLTVQEMSGKDPLDSMGLVLRVDDAEHMAETVLSLVAEARDAKATGTAECGGGGDER